MFCAKCGRANKEHAQFCGSCGVLMDTGVKGCSVCGFNSPHPALFCLNCGVKFARADKKGKKARGASTHFVSVQSQKAAFNALLGMRTQLGVGMATNVAGALPAGASATAAGFDAGFGGGLGGGFVDPNMMMQMQMMNSMMMQPMMMQQMMPEMVPVYDIYHIPPQPMGMPTPTSMMRIPCRDRAVQQLLR